MYTISPLRERSGSFFGLAAEALLVLRNDGFLETFALLETAEQSFGLCRSIGLTVGRRPIGLGCACRGGRILKPAAAAVDAACHDGKC